MTNKDSSTGPDIIVLEFNELCPNLMDQMIGQDKLPNFKRLRDGSVAMITDAEEASPQLEPWIQWPTIHSGLKADEHQIFDLGESRKLKQSCLAKIISDQGIPVGILGSMNTNYRDLDGFFIPDPWDHEGKAEPAELQPFYQTVAKQVQDSSSEEGISKKDLMQFGWFMIRHGMRSSTIRAGLTQLMAERIDKGVQWRRSLILERLQFDLFRFLKKKYQTRFNTFFCNSTAHFQHYYWRNMEPEIFSVPPGENDHPSLRTAIEEGYVQMDGLVGEFMREFPNSRMILLTAISQEPWKETTKCTYRPRNFYDFLHFVGVSPDEVDVKPVMAEEFHLICRSPDQRQEIGEKILQAMVNGQPAMKARLEEDGLFCGCAVNDVSARQATVDHPIGGKLNFDDMFHMVHSMRSGRHQPHGLFWVQSETPRLVPDPVPLVDVTPTILGLFDIPAPPRMSGEFISIDATQCAVN